MSGEAVRITEDTADVLWGSQEFGMGAFSQSRFALKANVSSWTWPCGMLTAPGRRAVLRSGPLYVFNFELEEESYGESWVSDNEVWSPDVQSLAARDGKAV